MILRSVLVLAVGPVCALSAATPAAAQYYRSHAEIGQILLDAQTDYPTLAQRHNLGYSYQNRELWAICITDNVGVEEDEPEFTYISTMHGNEIIGNEMCLYLIDHLLTNYGSDPDIANLVDEIEIWIVPLMNPDGYEDSPRTRYNAQGYDLNRTFPEGSGPYPEPNDPTGRPTEVQVIMNWRFGRSFTLSANIHTGALVANYPFDNDGMGSVFSPTPDEDLFVWISEEYSQYNLPMWNSPSFYHGITNGADWYAISGGMQDWSYRYMGGNEVTLELSNTFQPPASQLPTYWSQNRDSMLAYLETCLVGIRGIVTDAITGEPLEATISVVGRDHDIYTDPVVGDYHRMLMPGTYDLTVTPATYGGTATVEDVVVLSGDATQQDVAIWRSAQVSHPNGGESLPVNTEATVTWIGDPQGQFQVQYRNQLDPIMADDFEGAVLGPEYTTGGDQDWFLTTDDFYEGAQSARAGAIVGASPGQVSWMTRTVDSGGILRFWYRVSSEKRFDLFRFFIDDEEQFNDSGTDGGWEFYTTTLSEESHELKWQYSKDYSVSNGDDTVYIDDLQLLPPGGDWTDIVALTAPGASSAPWTPTVPGSNYAIRVRPYYSDIGYGDWDESDANFSVFGVVSDGDYDDDGDVDLGDFGWFQICFYTAATGDCGDAFEFIADGVIDLDDFAEFMDLMLGP